MKILLGDFNEKLGIENIFKLTIRNESLHQDSNDNGVDKKNQLDVTFVFFISLLIVAQHVSGNHVHIIRS